MFLATNINANNTNNNESNLETLHAHDVKFSVFVKNGGQLLSQATVKVFINNIEVANGITNELGKVSLIVTSYKHEKSTIVVTLDGQTKSMSNVTLENGKFYYVDFAITEVKKVEDVIEQKATSEKEAIQKRKKDDEAVEERISKAKADKVAKEIEKQESKEKKKADKLSKAQSKYEKKLKKINKKQSKIDKGNKKLDKTQVKLDKIKEKITEQEEFLKVKDRQLRIDRLRNKLKKKQLLLDSKLEKLNKKYKK